MSNPIDWTDWRSKLHEIHPKPFRNCSQLRFCWTFHSLLSFRSHSAELSTEVFGFGLIEESTGVLRVDSTREAMNTKRVQRSSGWSETVGPPLRVVFPRIFCLAFGGTNDTSKLFVDCLNWKSKGFGSEGIVDEQIVPFAACITKGHAATGSNPSAKRGFRFLPTMHSGTVSLDGIWDLLVIKLRTFNR